MTDLISRSALLDHFRKERQTFFDLFAPRDGQPDRKFTMDFSEILDELDNRVILIEHFAAVAPVAKLVNNNQVGSINLIETVDPNKTIDIGTMLYVSR